MDKCQALTVAPEAVAVVAAVAKVAPAWNRLVEADAQLVARAVHQLHRAATPHARAPAHKCEYAQA